MAKTLAANVFVDGDLYLVGDTPPKEIADQITNPKAWGDDSQPEPIPAKKTAAKKAASSGK